MTKELHGLNVLIGEEDEDAHDPIDVALQEVMGSFDMSSVSPYLSAFASGFGGDDKKKDDDAQKAREAAARAKAEMEAAKASSRTTLWVVLGIVGVALVGGGIFVATRKR